MTAVQPLDPQTGIDPLSLIPSVRLFGAVNEAMLAKFLDGLTALGPGDPLVVELTTPGGDADIGRRIALECRLAGESGRETWFLGKTVVMSAGVTIMSGFPAERRFIDRVCELLIHERRMDKQLHIFGPLRSSIKTAEEMIAQLQSGLRLEDQGFEDLVRDTQIPFEELRERVSETNWYISADEALKLGLVAGTF
jgi:ATP-dependent protease ClpP protease subunit